MYRILISLIVAPLLALSALVQSAQPLPMNPRGLPAPSTPFAGQQPPPGRQGPIPPRTRRRSLLKRVSAQIGAVCAATQGRAHRAKAHLRRNIKQVVWKVLPLAQRKRLAIWLDRQQWLPSRHYWSMSLIRDLAEKDVDSYHRFLWSHHLGYAKLYDAANGFGAAKLLATRRILFADLAAYLKKQGIDPARDVKSIFEVGCSRGYLLRFAETEVFPSATEIGGIDIDRYAIQEGKEYLESRGSKIHLQCTDMADLDNFMGEKTYDVILCAGVLMYLKKEAAERVVRAMIRHARSVVAIAGLAHPGVDNFTLARSERRWDAALIHNIDAMVQKAGGELLYRRWEGPRLYGGQSVYFVFCSGSPPASAAGPTPGSTTHPSEEAELEPALAVTCPS